MSVHGSGGATAYFLDDGDRPPAAGRDRGGVRRCRGHRVDRRSGSRRSRVPAWSASPVVRRSAGRWWRTSASTHASTTRTTTCRPLSRSTAQRASTSSTTTSAATSSTRCWAAWRRRPGGVVRVISSYLTGEHPGPSNYVNLLSRSATMQGFNALQMWDRFDEAFTDLRRWGREGLLIHRETVFEGWSPA